MGVQLRLSRRALLAIPVGVVAGYGACALGGGRERVPRVGFLAPATGDEAEHWSIFVEALERYGYTQGKAVDLRFRLAIAEPERLRAAARELVVEGVDVIVASSTPAALAARDATDRVPILFVGVADPVAVGLVSHPNQPSHNVSGVVSGSADLMAKRMELLRELLPLATRVGVLWDSATRPSVSYWTEAEENGRSLGFTLHPLPLIAPAELEPMLAAAAQQVDALVVLHDPQSVPLRQRIVELATRHRLPGVYPGRRYAEAGGIIAYGPTPSAMYRQAAEGVRRFLEGTPVHRLALQQADEFELAINLRSAAGLGLEVPARLLRRASWVLQ